MANYYPVSPRFWPTARRLGWDDALRNLALYVLTCEHRNLEGLYRLPLAYAAADLGWKPARVEAGVRVLERDEFVVYDHDSHVIFICKALKWYQPKSERQIAGAINSLRQVPDTPLLKAFLRAADTHAEPFAMALREAFQWDSDTHSNGVKDGVGIPMPNSARTHNSRDIDNSKDNSTSTTKGKDTPPTAEGSTTTPGPAAGLFNQVVADLERRAH